MNHLDLTNKLIGCERCKKSFGINYEKKLKAHGNSQKRLIVPVIGTEKLSINYPFGFEECKHTVCQDCLPTTNEAPENQRKWCPVCMDSSKECGSSSVNYQNFHINVELLGYAFLNSNSNSKFAQLNFDLNLKNMCHNNLVNKENIKLDFKRFLLACSFCTELTSRNNQTQKENQVETYCFNCMTAYCEICFKNYHNLDQDKSYHTPIPLQNIVINDLPCPRHKNTLNFYCKTEKQFVCSDCIVRSPKFNIFVEIISKKSRLEMISSYKKEFQSIDQKLKESITRLDCELERLVPENVNIKEHIIKSKNPAQIQHLKNEQFEMQQSQCIVEGVLAELNFLSNNLNNLLMRINPFQTDIENVLNVYLSLVSDTENSYKFEKNIRNSPISKVSSNNQIQNKLYRNQKSHNISNSKATNTNNESKSWKHTNYNKKIQAKKNLRSLETSTSSLVSTELENSNHADINNNQTLKIKNKNSSSEKLFYESEQYTTEYYETDDNTPNESNHAQRNKLDCGFQCRKNKLALEINSTHKAQIISFNSFSSIWVRFCADDANINSLSKSLIHWFQLDIEENQFNVAEQQSLCSGDIVGYFYEGDFKVWARAKITTISPSKIEPALESEYNVEIDKPLIYANIFLFDWGVYVEEIEITKLRKLRDHHLVPAPLAYECFMHNLEPYRESPIENRTSESIQNEMERNKSFVWPKISKNILLSWVDKKMIYLSILSKVGESYLGIDLLDKTSDYFGLINSKSSNNAYGYTHKIVSKKFSEVLLKTKIAMPLNMNLNANYLTELTQDIIGKMPSYMPMKTLYLEENLIAGISDFLLLREFHMRQLYVDNESDISYRDLVTRMENEYKPTKSANLQFFDPCVGMPVAALYKSEDKWYRAEIVRILPNAIVDVKFVDYGNIEQVSLFNVRFLNKEFFVDEVPIFKCRLFGIKFESDELLSEASNFFYEKIKSICQLNKKTTQVHIKNIIPDPNPSSTIKRIYEIILRFPIEEKLTNFNILLTKLDYAKVTNMSIYDGEKEPVKIKAIKSPHIMKAPLPSSLELTVKEISAMPNKLVNSTPDTKVLCKVLNAFSPDEIWVQDIADAEDCYEKFKAVLCEKYTKIYEENEVCKDEWEVNELCVVKSSRRKEFFRAKIIERNNNETFKVIYLDIGHYDNTVEQWQMFKLIDEFKEKPEFKAKKCHLIGVEPAGTTNGEWSHLAKTQTMEILNDNYVHVEFRSDKKTDDSFDACIYIDVKKNSKYNLDDQNTKTFIRFAEILNSKGLAFLDEKKFSLDKLLANRKAIKSGSLISPQNSFQNYLPCPSIPAFLKRDKNMAEHIFDVLVTEIDYENEKIYVQFYKDLNTNRVLAEMQNEFINFYDSAIKDRAKFEEKKYTINFLKEILKHNHLKNDYEPNFSSEFLHKTVESNHTQACVCKINEKFYRCKLLDVNKNRETTYLVQSIDYGFHSWVHRDKIFRPMIKYLDYEPLAFQLKLFISTTNNLKENYLQMLQVQVYNKLVKLKIISINESKDNLTLIGDLFDRSQNAWCTNFLSNHEHLFEHELTFSKEIDFPKLSPFELPVDFEKKAFKVLIGWDQVASRMIWLQFEPGLANYIADENIINNIENYKEMETDFLQLHSSGSLKLLEIHNVLEDMPCCSVYNDLLYRAIIKDINYIANTATIQYIDFGNVEEVDLEKIFELDQKYLTLPKHAVCCKVCQVIIDQNIQNEYNTNEMSSVQLFSMLDQEAANLKLYAIFKSMSKSELDLNASYEIEVDLFISDEETSRLPCLQLETILEKDTISLS